MPTDDNGVGFSDHTADKLRIYRGLVKTWLRMAYGAAKGRMIWHFDLNAGPGIHSEYGAGSPIIFCEEAERLAQDKPDFRYRALMVDCSNENVTQLRQHLDARGYYNATATCAVNGDILTEYAQAPCNKLALFYFDPTKPSDMPWDEMMAITKSWWSGDILMYIPATSVKRVQNRWGNPSLADVIRNLGKPHVSIMQPYSKFQWTFIYATKGPPLVWENIRFYSINSDRGRAILELVTTTKREREELSHNAFAQLSLF